MLSESFSFLVKAVCGIGADGHQFQPKGVIELDHSDVSRRRTTGLSLASNQKKKPDQR